MSVHIDPASLPWDSDPDRGYPPESGVLTAAGYVDDALTALAALTMATERLLTAGALPPDLEGARLAVRQARVVLGLDGRRADLRGA